MKIKVLGAFGSKLKNMGMVSFFIDEKIVVDAGNIVSPLGEKSFEINHIFLTHHHLDHIADIPFLLAESFPVREEPFRIYAQKETLKALKKYIMNSDVWPDFSKIKIIGTDRETVDYIEIKPWVMMELNGFEITPFPSNHIVPTVGFKVSKGEKSVIFTGDTWKQNNVWDIANQDRTVKAIFIDVSYPKKVRKLGEISKHLSTDALEEEIESKLKREDIKIFVVHVKPIFHREVEKEIDELRRKTGIEIRILKDGDEIKI